MKMPMRMFRRNKSFTDEELMTRTAKGDGSAFEQLYNRFAPRLKGFFLRMTGREAELSEDLMQEVMMRVYENAHLYRSPASVSSWIFAMAYNLCKNHYRHEAVKNVFEERCGETATAFDDNAFEKLHDRSLFDKDLRKALDSLSDEQRASFTLRYEEELSIAEIARIMNCPEGTVKSRLHQTMNILSRKLASYKSVLS